MSYICIKYNIVVLGVAGGGTRRPRGVHILDDAALLLLLQPAAAHS